MPGHPHQSLTPLHKVRLPTNTLWRKLDECPPTWKQIMDFIALNSVSQVNRWKVALSLIAKCQDSASCQCLSCVHMFPPSLCFLCVLVVSVLSWPGLPGSSCSLFTCTPEVHPAITTTVYKLRFLTSVFTRLSVYPSGSILASDSLMVFLELLE